MTRCTVQKFGGACFATRERLRLVAQRLDDGSELPAVVVVSAQEGVTDLLASQMRDLGVSNSSPARDLLLATGELQSAALLAGAVVECGGAAVVVAPWLVFRTNAVFGDATITEVHKAPVLDLLDRGIVPIVPGFIGATAGGQITTLGRGGSDYSAVALGAALSAVRVELYKAEVDGIYDADPRKHREAQRYENLTHGQALQLARSGAKVLQAKAAALAYQWALPVVVKPAFGEGPGTTIGIRKKSPRKQLRAMGV
jgi:aspartate kinase